jgi:siroheme synthase-like protein
MDSKSVNELFPIFLKAAQLKILVVGGGNVALEKLTALFSNSPQAQVICVAPQIKPEIIKLQQDFPHLTLLKRTFSRDDLKEKHLVICTTDDPGLHESIQALAAPEYLLTNVADTPALCDFYLSSVVRKGNLKIAISTNGLSPTAAKRLRELLDECIPSEIDDVLNQLHQIRNKLTGDFKSKVEQMMVITEPMASRNQEKVLKFNRWQPILWALAGFISGLLVAYLIKS